MKVGGEELIFLNLLLMRDTHNNFQLPSSKTATLIEIVEMGEILPPQTLPQEGGGGAVDLLH